jgi:mRNA-degrading endonuclease RelE of RelBE toxin-antitoxin system
VSYRVEQTPEFERDFARLDPETAARISAKVEWLAEHPEAIPGPMKHLPRDLTGLRK